MPDAAELEIELRRRRASEGDYAVEFRLSLPGSAVDVRSGQGQPPRVRLDLGELRVSAFEPNRYAQTLSTRFFADEEVKKLFDRARTGADAMGVPLRVRLLVDPKAPELHNLYWEMLRDPENGRPLFMGENVFFSRYLSSLDLRPVRLSSRADLKALVFIASPSDLAGYNLDPIQADEEYSRACAGLGTIPAERFQGGPATLEGLVEALRSQKPDILYLVCHGGLVRDKPYLWLEKADGTSATTPGEDLVARIQELSQPPALVVLASCKSAGHASAGSARGALGPLLAEAGIPAVVAMLGEVTVPTVAEFMPAFFQALEEDGQVDRAMSLARGRVRERPDYWMPVLFTRLISGCIFDEESTSPVAIGSRTAQNGLNGLLVNPAPPAEQPVWQRGGRLDEKSRKPRTFLDRTSEIQRIDSDIQAGQPLILCGPEGIGKSTLIDQLTYIARFEQFTDGLYYLSARDLKLEDLLQCLFSAFYQIKDARIALPNRAQLQSHMRKIKALILLDDLMLPRDELRILLNIAPQCVFILASTQPGFRTEIECLSLGGLPESEALPLFEQELGRGLAGGEKAITQEICRLLKGHPQTILAVAAKIREEGCALTEIVSTLASNSPEHLLQESIQAIPQVEQQILRILAAADGQIVPQEHITALVPVDVEKIQEALDHLIERRLVQAHSPAYSLVEAMQPLVTQSFTLFTTEEALIQYFTGWLEQRPADQKVMDARGALLAVIRKAFQHRRWAETIRMGRAIERVLFLHGYWKAWEEILRLVLEAAKALGEHKVEAWALHQLGSRLLCLDSKDQARELLKRAAAMRHKIGDLQGLAITQHNLSLIPGFLPPLSEAIKAAGSHKLLITLATLGSVAVLGAATVLGPILFRPASPSLTQPADGVIETTTRQPGFAWQAVSNAESYRLQVDDREDFAAPEFDSTEAATSRSLDTMLEQGVYYWRVQAIGRSENAGEWSETRRLTISIPPAAPALFQPADGSKITGNASLVLAWENAANAANYRAQVDENSRFNSPEYEFNTPATSITARTELEQGEYFWRVQAINRYDTPGQWSPAWKFLMSIPPDAPGLGKPSEGFLIEGTTTPGLEWLSTTYGAGYEVQVDDDAGFSSPEFDITTTALNSSVNIPLRQGEYSWRVRAINLYDTPGEWSPARHFIISIAPGIPILVQPVDESQEETTATPALEWEGVPGGAAYQVQVDDNGNFASPEVDATTPSTSSAVKPALKVGEYTWRVRAMNTYGTPGLWSVAWKFTINTDPNAPALAQPANGSLVETTTTPALEWRGAENGATYQVQVDNNDNFSSPEYDSTTSSLNSTVDSTLKQGEYSWRARAINRYGKPGQWSTTWKFTISIPPILPTLVKPVDGFLEETTATPGLQWRGVPNGATYQVQVDNNGDFNSPEFDASTSTLTSTVSMPLEQGVYSWRVRALNPYGTPSPWTPAWKFTNSIPPGIPLLSKPENGYLEERTTTPALEWMRVENGATYQVQVDNHSNFASPEHDATTPTTNSTVSTALKQGEYSWRVRALNIYKTPGKWSKAWKFTISVPPGTPELVKPGNGSLEEKTTRPALQWKAAVNGTTYQVQVDDNGNFSSPEYDATTSMLSSTVKAALKQGEYNWRVRAMNVYKTPGQWSAAWKFVVSIPPDAPALLEPNSGSLFVSPTRPALGWSSVANAVQYQVQVDNSAGFNAPEYETTTGTGAIITPELPQGIYSWRVRAINTYKTPGKWSATWKFTISTPPGIPVLLKPGDGELAETSGRLALQWQGVPDGATYQVQVDDSDGFTSPEYDNTAPGTNRTTSVLKQGDYYWRARALNIYKTPGQWSATWKIALSVPTATPTLRTPSHGKILEMPATPVLAWSEVTNAVEYHWQLDDSSGFGSPAYDMTTMSTSSSITWELPQGVYYWRVQGINVYKTPGRWSAAWQFVISIPPGVPTLYEPVNGNFVPTTTPSFTWSSAWNAKNYRLEVDDNANFQSVNYYYTTSKTSNTATRNLPQGVYYWRVRALNAYQTPGNWSSTGQFIVNPKPATPALSAPAQNKLIEDTTRPGFTWQSVANAVRYQLQVSNNASFYYLVFDDPNLPAVGYTLHFSLAQGQYYWRVRAFNVYGKESDWSAARQFTISIRPTTPQLFTPEYGDTSDAYPGYPIEFSWSSVYDAEKYEIQISDDTNFYSVKKSYWLFDTRITVNRSDLKPPDYPCYLTNDYYWRVRAVNAYGSAGPWSSTWYFIYERYCIEY